MPSQVHLDGRRRRAARLALALGIGLAILHQDFWFWHYTTLVFGFLPIGLLYHMGYAIAASMLFVFVSRCVWPETVADDMQAEDQPVERLS